MENSFYYFFSATPQVLGGVLALFGIFMIFKIERLQIEILGLSKNIQSEIMTVNNSKGLINWVMLNEFFDAFQESNSIENFESINYNAQRLEIWIKEQGAGNSKYFKGCSTIITKTGIRKLIIKESAVATKYIICTIILCLGILPFGNWIIVHPVFLWTFFATVITMLVYCFSKFYNVFRLSLGVS